MRLKSKSLENGSFIRLQPHTKELILVLVIGKVLERRLSFHA